MSRVLFCVNGEWYFEFYDCALVVIEVTVVGSREDGDNSRKLLLPAPMIHLKSIRLSLMSSNNRQQSIFTQKTLS